MSTKAELLKVLTMPLIHQEKPPALVRDIIAIYATNVTIPPISILAVTSALTFNANEWP